MRAEQLSPILSPEEKENNMAATKNAYQMFILPFVAEFHVIKSLFVVICVICRDIVILPISLIISSKRSPQFLYILAVFFSIIIAYGAIHLTGFNFETGLEMMKIQKFYKLWAMYTLFSIAGKFFQRIQKHTHRMIAGALQGGGSIVLAIVAHSISNILLFIYYSVVVGCYLAGIDGKAGLYLSCCLHIQAVITKKFLPKTLDVAPIPFEPINRFIVILSLLVDSNYHDFKTSLLIIIFEYGCAFIRYFLVSLTEDAPKYRKACAEGDAFYWQQLRDNDAPVETSIFVNVPHEALAMSLLSIILNLKNRQLQYYSAGAVCIFAIIVPLLCGKPKKTAEKVKLEELKKPAEKSNGKKKAQ